jgi:predicted nuclease of predicted toxin-antitoxin system
VKLLLDQNLSRRLLPDLVQSFPGSTQVQHAGLESAGDADIWAYAKQHGFAIVTKDADFAELALLRGYPPKVIWLNCGNVNNATVHRKLLDNAAAIQLFIASVENAVLEIE